MDPKLKELALDWTEEQETAFIGCFCSDKPQDEKDQLFNDVLYSVFHQKALLVINKRRSQARLIKDTDEGLALDMVTTVYHGFAKGLKNNNEYANSFGLLYSRLMNAFTGIFNFHMAKCRTPLNEVSLDGLPLEDWEDSEVAKDVLLENEAVKPEQDESECYSPVADKEFKDWALNTYWPLNLDKHFKIGIDQKKAAQVILNICTGKDGFPILQKQHLRKGNNIIAKKAGVQRFATLLAIRRMADVNSMLWTMYGATQHLPSIGILADKEETNRAATQYLSRCKFTGEQRKTIRAELSQGASAYALGIKYGCARQTIQKLKDNNF